MDDTTIAVTLGVGIPLIGFMAILAVARANAPVGRRAAARAVTHLPASYQEIALREMDVTRRAGVTVTPRTMRTIVDAVERLARERGAIA